ncbi:MAC/perforin domain-containing protein [Bacteroides fragilis]|jgi:hypothetical protein|uniref:MAC/perforin domain-containing protein n=1 Tax=Bacteroides fragilis TaxID=817 RepID=UPI00202F17D6|nr:MAC/perforin domain-containing protein [Bacteroides fragilis]DAO85631.1 MAG TPA: hypothetical protein [Caudoviricetes sp.]MCM0193953.1 hypothetical protein [Bacteroides fragilis]MCM0201302.1 hypothetical protein [Bacteroides fragilis]MCM0211872.1 hypothetical protein [Bacteroides fragilis]MCM0216541.1 hypothetical protein [Bacteroides fragilis]
MDEVKNLSIELQYDYTEDVDIAKINEVIKTGFGYGTNITNALGNKQAPIFDYDKLEADGLLIKDPSSDCKSYIIEGKSYAQVTSEINQTFGVSSTDLLFNNTLKTSLNNAMKNADDYEYGVRIFLCKALGVSLNTPSDYTPYIQDKALHDICGIAVNGKVTYPTNDKSKLKKLFNLYGTHIITKAIFGCRYQYYYMRESINQQTVLKSQVDCNLSGKFGREDGLGDLGVALGQHYDESYANSTNREKSGEFTEWVGGGKVETFAIWESGMDFLKPNTIAFVGYVMPGASNDSGLIPLWDIVSDPERVQKMTEAYQEYLQENTAVIRKSKKVIIDVFGRYFEKDEAPDSIVEADHNNVVRKFMKINEEALNHVHGITKGAFYFYYALAYSTDGGLSEIKFANKKDPCNSPWIKRGDDAQIGVTGCMDDNVVLIKPVKPDSNRSQDDYENGLISGFGLEVEGKKKSTVKQVSEGSNPDMNWTTGGCDWYKGLSHDKIHCIYTKDKI